MLDRFRMNIRSPPRSCSGVMSTFLQSKATQIPSYVVAGIARYDKRWSRQPSFTDEQWSASWSPACCSCGVSEQHSPEEWDHVIGDSILRSRNSFLLRICTHASGNVTLYSLVLYTDASHVTSEADCVSNSGLLHRADGLAITISAMAEVSNITIYQKVGRSREQGSCVLTDSCRRSCEILAIQVSFR